MEIGTVNVIRHTVNFDVMSCFYVEGLGMSPVEEWVSTGQPRLGLRRPGRVVGGDD